MAKVAVGAAAGSRRLAKAESAPAPETVNPEYPHEPVMRAEVLRYLNPRSGLLYVDATVGGAGHAHDVLEASSPSGTLLGLDRNPKAVAAARRRLVAYGDRVAVAQANFADLHATLAERESSQPVGGVLFDLGLASAELADSQMGFSFQVEGPLTMRYDGSSGEGLTAAEVVNGWPEAELAAALKRYGEEPLATQIARRIVESRPISTTTQLADLVSEVYRRRYGRSRRHPATRTFQALRVVVNGEVEALSFGLSAAAAALASGGRLVVISYHSVEDRTVKRFFKLRPELDVLTKRPVTASAEEVEANPRARSAKLRAAQRR